MLGRSQVVRHRSLDPAFVGSSPPAPAIYFLIGASNLLVDYSFFRIPNNGFKIPNEKEDNPESEI